MIRCTSLLPPGRRKIPTTVLATQEFVVNVPSFEREILEEVRVVGLEFPPGVNELEKAGIFSEFQQLRITAKFID